MKCITKTLKVKDSVANKVLFGFPFKDGYYTFRDIDQRDYESIKRNFVACYEAEEVSLDGVDSTVTDGTERAISDVQSKGNSEVEISKTDDECSQPVEASERSEGVRSTRGRPKGSKNKQKSEVADGVG
jgi:hypothetical protein